MSLKYQLDSLDGVDESLHPLYSEQDGVYVLNVEDAVPKSKFLEFRNNNIKLKKQADELAEKLSEYDGIDLEKVRKAQDLEKKLREKKLIEEGQLDTLFQEKFGQFKADFEKERKSLNDQIEQLQKERHHVRVTSVLKDAAIQHGVDPAGLDYAVMEGERIFRLDGEKMVAKIGDQEATDGAGNPLTPESFYKSVLPKQKPLLYKSSKGGNAQGSGNGAGGAGHRTLTRAEFDALRPAEKQAFLQSVRSAKAELTD